MENILGRKGLLAEGLESYEYRPQQVEMAEAVWRALTQGGNLIVEAGPGTGKTFAYLIPALYSGHKVVVSTGTKNLQEQIFFKDIPLLKEFLPISFKAAYMKGRENYLCWRRFKLFERQPLFKVMEETSLFGELKRWASRTQTGDRSELEGIPEDFSTWGEICCSRDHCLGTNCPDYKRCFLTHMRQEAAEAQLIVVNHHLFFADLAVRDVGGEVIPRYKRVIFDEAHQLEEVITNYFGLAVSNYRVEELARDVRRELTKGRKPTAGLQRAVDALLVKSADLFSLFQGEEKYRLQELDPILLSLLSDIKKSLAALREIMGKRRWREEIASLIHRAQELEGDIEFILSMGDPAYVYWCENRGRGVFLRASPIDVWPEVSKRLYPRVEAMVFTSATLSTQGGFDYFRERLGLGEAEELILPSPFDFQRQVVIYLPEGLPEPHSPTFPRSAATEIEAILEITKGRAFALFTSYKNMREVYSILRGRLPYRLLIQGEGPKHLLLEEFKGDVQSVLLATSSFWEGVDVPGEALSCVIIDKLPFDAPTEPVVQARIERIASQGGNPFYQYQIPAAIITLKQGLGRLIRSREDCGVLSILDTRLVTKGYGKIFLQSLPPAPVVQQREEIKRVFE
ncbi:MAG: ATP-dependent DNA helicase [Deltaproteobacteria bacterium]|nr:MAG: ATP-dependent DNA helicase [Deltaproteobacteria bacterium]